MKKITIYSSNICPYCLAAKKLLQDEGLKFTEISVDGKPKLREELRLLVNGKTSVPQIFFDKELIGGYDNLLEIFSNGKYLKILND
tara:strand:+ start:300 stop:557 length:258 start_codon:yes stop_codon:yes gene_type:complete